jgi:hypothetical protein
MDFVERWDRHFGGWLQRSIQRVLGGDRGVEFLESYAAALDEVRDKVQFVGGRRIFPYKRVSLTFAVDNPAELPGLTEALSQRKQLIEDVNRALDEAGCERPTTLRVDASAVLASSRGLARQSYEVAFASDLPGQPPLTLQIETGETEEPVYAFGELRINIGRRKEIHDEQRRLIRRNHVVFLERATGVNSTVSRMHAHITFDESIGWYRLFDDQSRFGTRISRGESLIDVPTGPQGGAWLRPGDELHLGQARLRASFHWD